MSMSEYKPSWFRFEKGVPAISAAVGDLLLLDDAGQVWVCHKQGPYFDLTVECRQSLVCDHARDRCGGVGSISLWREDARSLNPPAA